MNPFQRYNIEHLSASSLNLYAEEPAFWSLVYLHGYKDQAGPKAWRGSAVEAGLDIWLYRRDFQEALQAAYTRFESDALGDLSEDVDSQRKLLQGILERACEACQGRPEPVSRQLKIEHWFDG